MNSDKYIPLRLLLAPYIYLCNLDFAILDFLYFERGREKSGVIWQVVIVAG